MKYLPRAQEECQSAIAPGGFDTVLSLMQSDGRSIEQMIMERLLGAEGDDSSDDSDEYYLPAL